MTPKEFQERLVGLLHRRPFIPFEVEMLYGLRFIVDRPDAVSWNGGAAGFIDGDGEIYFFDSKDTKEMGRNPYASSV